MTGTAREALIIGAGAQAAAHLEALREGLGVRHFYITARTLESAERLAAAANGDGVAAEAVPNAEAVAQKVSLIVTATTSEAPVVPAGVTDHTTILAVGAFRPDMAELPARLIARSNVVVDTLEGAQAEAGDLIQAQAAGVWSWDTAVEFRMCWRARAPEGTQARRSSRAWGIRCSTLRRPASRSRRSVGAIQRPRSADDPDRPDATALQSASRQRADSGFNDMRAPTRTSRAGRP